jgi:hypothetical protein
MFSSLFINPYPIYNSMENSKLDFSIGAKRSLHWYWSLCYLMNECFCIVWFIVSGVCVCVSFSLSLALSLTIIFPLSSIPCLNLLNNVRFDICWLFWFYMPLMNWMTIYKLMHESMGEGDQWHLVIKKCEDLIMYVFSLCLLNAYWHHGRIFLLCDRHLWCRFFVIVSLEFWVVSHMLIYTHD